MLLLVGAGLFVRTLVNLNAADTGFQQKGLLLFAIVPPRQRYPAPKNIECCIRSKKRSRPCPEWNRSHCRGACPGANGVEDGFFPDGQPRRPGHEQFAL